MKIAQKLHLVFHLIILLSGSVGFAQLMPWEIEFSRQGVLRPALDDNMAIPLAGLDPGNIVGLEVMHPSWQQGQGRVDYSISDDELLVSSAAGGRAAMWFGPCNPFALYTIEIGSLTGDGLVGIAFADVKGENSLQIFLEYKAGKTVLCRGVVYENGKETASQLLSDNRVIASELPIRFHVQMLGSGLTAFVENKGLPQIVGQWEFNRYFDLRAKQKIHSWHSLLLTELKAGGELAIGKVTACLSAGIGLADLRAITYEDGSPCLDKGRLWYTISIRGRQLPHHVQGVFSLNPSVFDLKLEGIILFDRSDDLLRNEIASHIYFDRRENVWRGVTTGFSCYANPEKEVKEIWAVESKRDPRFGMSIMSARQMGLVGNFEDAHIIYDELAGKWRMLLCENTDGPYRAVVRESDRWDGGFEKIAGPVKVDSTGTQIQMFGSQRYCLFGSADRCLYVFSYPDLKQMGKLKLDLPPWNESSGTRVWTNVVPLPQGYPARFVALTMDRFNYPGITGPNWSYGALYLYHGWHKDLENTSYEYQAK